MTDEEYEIKPVYAFPSVIVGIADNKTKKHEEDIDGEVAYFSIAQSSMFPLSESKLMSTLVIGLPQRAKRWR